MGINVTSYNYNGPRRRKARSSSNSLGIFATTLKISVPFCLLFAAAITRVMWTSQAESINKESISLENRINDIDRETANLNIGIEQKSGKDILAQVKKYNLDLHYPQPGQIKKLEVAKASPVVKSEPVVKQPANAKPIIVSQKNGAKTDVPAKYYR